MGIEPIQMTPPLAPPLKERGSLVADLEAAEAFRRFFLDHEVLDSGVGRAAPHSFDHPGDGAFVAGKMRSTEPSGRLRIQPLTPSSRACPWAQTR